MDEKTVNLLLSKLDTIIKLMALRMTEGKKQVDQIQLLSKAGFGPKEIADTIGTTSNTVSVARAAIKKQKSSSRTRQKGGNKGAKKQSR